MNEDNTQAVVNYDAPISEILHTEQIQKNVMTTAHESLASHSEAFFEFVFQALRNNQALAKSDKKTIVAAVRKAARMGLLPDGEQCGLVSIGGKADCWVMVKGLEYLYTSTGIVNLTETGIIYEREVYSIKKGTSPVIEHTPIYDVEARGDPIIYYAIARSDHFQPTFHVMGIAEIMAVRDEVPAYKYFVSKGGKKPAWVTNFTEMALKTVKGRLLRSISRGLAKKDVMPHLMEASQSMAPSETGEVYHASQDVIEDSGNSNDDLQDTGGSGDDLGGFLGGDSLEEVSDADEANSGDSETDLGDDSTIGDILDATAEKKPATEPAIKGSRLGDITYVHKFKSGQGLVHFKLTFIGVGDGGDSIKGDVALFKVMDKDGNESDGRALVGVAFEVPGAFRFQISELFVNSVVFSDGLKLWVGESVGYSN